MKQVYKILLVAAIILISSCSKEELKEEVIECNCKKTSYRVEESIGVSNGLPKFVVKNVVTKVENNIGCFTESTIYTSENTFQVIECRN